MRAAVAGLVLIAAPFVAIGAQLPEGPAIPDNPLDGRRLFESKRCLECHDLVGGEGGLGPSLGAGRFDGTFLDLGADLWNHVPGMRVSVQAAGLEWPTLRDAEVVELIAFLYFIDYLGQPGDAVAGREVFLDEGCVACHDVGDGGDKVGPDLADLDRFASPLFVAQEIWNHGPAMLETIHSRGMRTPSFAAGDLADLAAYIRQQAGPSPGHGPFLAPGNPNAGEGLFSAKGCSRCHGADARGGDGGPDLQELDVRQSAEAISGRMWNHALDMRDAMRERGVGWPRFEGNELADLVAFLYFLPFADAPGDPRRGEELFRTRSCVVCHVESREAIGAPDLVASDATATTASLVAAMWNHAPAMLDKFLSEVEPWAELTGSELRDLFAYLQRMSAERQQADGP